MSVQCVDERAALHEGGPHGIGAERERQRDRERERERDRERERESAGVRDAGCTAVSRGVGLPAQDPAGSC